MSDDFRQILSEYQDRVYNQSYRMLGNREDAEEAAQDIFLKIYQSLDTSLKAEWAMAISLYHFEDLSYQEIADIMDIPTATVATYILRGRNQLARRIMKVYER